MRAAHLANTIALLLPRGLTTKTPAKRNISWLNHTAFPLPVYAPCSLSTDYAIRQLTDGCWLGFTGWDLDTHRFPVKGFKEQ